MTPDAMTRATCGLQTAGHAPRIQRIQYAVTPVA